MSWSCYQPKTFSLLWCKTWRKSRKFWHWRSWNWTTFCIFAWKMMINWLLISFLSVDWFTTCSGSSEHTLAPSDTHSASRGARVVPTHCPFKQTWQFGPAAANQLAQRLAKWSETYESEFSGSAHVRVCDCLWVCGETRTGENCVKRFPHNKQKLRLTQNSLPSAACRCYASAHPSKSNLLTVQTQLLTVRSLPAKLGYFTALSEIIMLWATVLIQIFQHQKISISLSYKCA